MRVQERGVRVLIAKMTSISPYFASRVTLWDYEGQWYLEHGSGWAGPFAHSDASLAQLGLVVGAPLEVELDGPLALRVLPHLEVDGLERGGPPYVLRVAGTYYEASWDARRARVNWRRCG